MILVLGGTTEGRAVVDVVDEAGTVYFYSTKSNLQQIEMVHGIRLTGAMDAVAMTAFCKEKEIRLIIDATHPFATLLHDTVETVSSELDIPVIRYERKFPPRDGQFIWCKDYTEAIYLLCRHNILHLLALTGVNTIAPLQPYWEKYDCWFRILDREESKRIVGKQGFPSDRIIYYKEEDNDVEKEKELIRSLQPDAILTKESGLTGNFTIKAEAARQMNIPLFVIQRPEIPGSFYKVYGEAGLRQQTDRLLPGFFPLRTGFTTGTCATAAVKAALLALLTCRKQTEIELSLPSGEFVCLPVSSTEITPEYARCTVVKEAGDDPDVTNHAEVIATVSLTISSFKHLPHVWMPIDDTRELILCAGEGIGTVTLPGLGLETGGPAINATPRKMILEEIRTVLDTSGYTVSGNILVILSVPDGEEIAKRTFNPKLGIEGGISIIGTSGIVRPFSHEAFVASIRKEMEVAKAMDCKHIVINSGAKSERFLKSSYPDLPLQAFIHYGNYIGETLQIASELQIPAITLGIMIGKAIKLAEGHMNTHSKKTVMNKQFLKDLASEAACPPDNIQEIEHITLARELWTLFPEKEYPYFYTLLKDKCYSHSKPLLPLSKLIICLIDEKGNSI
ncbi:MAG: cobalt-precorrin-5B (C(1))-methyltransferase CbiD [Tannerellaceae bacterium]|jgi:cobalt-precorrin-5B (C1)-methyltransferase|nr:cobalt-precorrin-5B (C(1))-methyltransferase CbiD [Tannerellaceae bacterium]